MPDEKQDERATTRRKKLWYDKLCWYIFLGLLLWTVIGILIKFL